MVDSGQGCRELPGQGRSPGGTVQHPAGTKDRAGAANKGHQPEVQEGARGGTRGRVVVIRSLSGGRCLGGFFLVDPHARCSLGCCLTGYRLIKLTDTDITIVSCYRFATILPTLATSSAFCGKSKASKIIKQATREVKPSYEKVTFAPAAPGPFAADPNGDRRRRQSGRGLQVISGRVAPTGKAEPAAAGGA